MEMSSASIRRFSGGVKSEESSVEFRISWWMKEISDDHSLHSVVDDGVMMSKAHSYNCFGWKLNTFFSRYTLSTEYRRIKLMPLNAICLMNGTRRSCGNTTTLPEWVIRRTAVLFVDLTYGESNGVTTSIAPCLWNNEIICRCAWNRMEMVKKMGLEIWHVLDCYSLLRIPIVDWTPLTLGDKWAP